MNAAEAAPLTAPTEYATGQISGAWQPPPDFPALDFILAEMFLRKILDSTVSSRLEPNRIQTQIRTDLTAPCPGFCPRGLIHHIALFCQCTTSPSEVFSSRRRHCSSKCDEGIQLQPARVFNFGTIFILFNMILSNIYHQDHQ